MTAVMEPSAAAGRLCAVNNWCTNGGCDGSECTEFPSYAPATNGGWAEDAGGVVFPAMAVGREANDAGELGIAFSAFTPSSMRFRSVQMTPKEALDFAALIVETVGLIEAAR
jgi:hypothetical protein